ncbi:hypothetical protein FDH01_gp004 [Acinetobacter phage vB_AbaM_ME3]|uniref:Putative membrane protein n=1 Tax=Acinetobacter phage vB_AbaM_ME3 TaxID=1837876 RepID=A0A172PZZ9_9CAUD|nr:hypothetical protein FDH01_gp004 [Acinetobacter phage vB_AbaM_ME3]AND75165.1 putative membrane protein [Acinetobacter phage vB_AbaM_ME3]
MNTFTRLCITLLIALPMSAMAGEYLTDKVDSVINWGFWSILLGALAGGIAATFIETEVDIKLSNDKTAKILIGTALGFFSCLTWTAYYPDTTMMKLALPSFVLGCLGAPIIAFLLSWAADPRTWRRANSTLNKRLGLEEDKKEDD